MTTPHSAPRTPHSGFTLVELLVVIGIIAVLASLILVGGRTALVAAREAAVHTEISQLDSAFTEYTNRISGGDYPPNVITDQKVVGSVLVGMSNNEKAAVYNAFKSHFNKAFPRHREPETLLAAIAGVAAGTNNLPGGLSPHEAIVFWLGGFSDDPKFPISGPGGPSFDSNTSTNPVGEDFSARTPIHDFDQTRLGPRRGENAFGGRVLNYSVDLNGNGNANDQGETRRINFWQYYPTKIEAPFAYFDASRTPQVDAVFQIGAVTPVCAIKQFKLNASGTAIANLRLVNEDKCQILAAGLDNSWGPFVESFGVDWANPGTNYAGLVYPTGPFTGELADTITNFSTSTTLEDSQQ